MKEEGLPGLARSKVLAFEGFQLDRARRLLKGPGDRPIDVNARVFDTLVTLVDKAGVVVPKNALMAAVWPGVAVEENNLNQAISALRKALGEAGKRLVVTVPGRGYQLAAEVQELADVADDPAPPHPAAASSEPVLAVLAFDNLSGDPEMAFFADSVSEEILLSVSRGIKVIGRGSSFQFRGADKAVRKIATELGATHVLDGAVRRAGGMIRISAQLINAANQITVWQMQYDRPARDLFAIQEEIAVAVADALDVKLSAARQSDEIDPETYEVYLRLTRKVGGDPVSERTRLTLTDEITRRAPLFGRGWLQAAQSRATAIRNVAMSSEERGRLHDEMRSAIERATQLLGVDDPMLTAIGVNWEPWAGAWTMCEKRLRLALERSPHSVNVKGVLGSLLLHAGRVSESVALFSDAAARDPLMARFAMGLGVGLSSAERHDEAFALLESACRRWPKVWFFWFLLVKAAAVEGRWDVVDRWITSEYLERYQRNANVIEDVVRMTEMQRNPDDQRRDDVLSQLREKAAATGRVRLSEAASASQLCSAGAVHDVIDKVSFAHLFDPIQGHLSGDLGVQALFTTTARNLRADPRFVRLCGRLGLVSHWMETDRWPDCADQVRYDFRAEARRLADTTLG